jgi:hypothetical protein
MKKDMFTLSRGLAMGRSLLRATSHEPPKAQIKGAEWMSTARKKERERENGCPRTTDFPI